MRRALVVAALAIVLASPASAAALDDAIDAAHVSHVQWQDCRPLCPVDNEAFTVRLYALAGDLSGVRVRFTDGTATWITAARIGHRGPYDVWQASLPASVSPLVRYYFELDDGSARAFWGSAGYATAPPADSGLAVDFATLSHAPLGATPTDDGAVFKVWAPDRGAAWVRGEFNGWGTGNPMQRVGAYFIARVYGAVPGQQYKYYFDNGKWSIDPRGRIYDPAGGYDNSTLANPLAYAWGDSAFAMPPRDRLVIYQLNVGTFAGLDDPYGHASFPSRFLDVAERVQHLADLGVNAVLLNPVTAAANLTYAGYNTIGPWSPNLTYGSPDDFKALVDACHQHGIAVLCDIVWNHIDPGYDLMWYWDGSQLYFSDPATYTPWGEQADFSKSEVADFYQHSALAWLEEYHVDGFRMDAVGDMSDGTPPAAGWALMQRFNSELDRRWTDKLRIAEQIPAVGQVTGPVAVGGAGFDTQYDSEFQSVLYWTLRWSVSASPYAGYVWSETGNQPPFASGHQRLTYLELHDNAWGPGNHRFLVGAETVPGVVSDTARALLRAGMGALMTLPGVPAVLMGDEWAETSDWGTTAANRIDWAKLTGNAGHFGWMRALVALREGTPAFFADAPCVGLHYDYDNSVVSWMRYDDHGQTWMMILNLSGNDFPLYQLGAPVAGAWAEELSSQAAAFGGTGMTNEIVLHTLPQAWDGLPQSLDTVLPRWSLVVLQSVATAGVGDVPKSGATRIESVFPSPTPGAAAVAFSLARAAAAKVEVFDARGARVATVADGPLAAGAHVVRWDGRDAGGRAVSAGIYFVQLRAGREHATRRIAVVH